MSRRSKVNSWNCVEPETPQERRADAPDEPVRPHGGSQKYKDKKHWCRGKIGGRRHTPEIRFGQHWSISNDYERARCYWSQYSDRSQKWYHCEHQEVCSNPQCRKVLDWSLGRKRCPDVETAPFYDPAWYAARRRELEELAASRKKRKSRKK